MFLRLHGIVRILLICYDALLHVATEKNEFNVNLKMVMQCENGCVTQVYHLCECIIHQFYVLLAFYANRTRTLS